MTTPRQLQVFITVAQGGNFRRAADQLGITQASVSNHINALERSLGDSLFVREKGRSVRLSEFGQQTFKKAVEIQELHSSIRAQLIPVKPAIKFYVKPLLFEKSIFPNLDALHEWGMPENIDFVMLDDSNDIAAMVSQGKATFGLYRIGSPNVHLLKPVSLSEAPCSVYVAKELSDQLDNDQLGLNDIPFLAPRGNSILYASLRSEILMRLRTLSEFYEPSAILDVQPFGWSMLEEVINGRGMAVLLDCHCIDHLEAGKLIKLPWSLTPFYTVLVASKECPSDIRDGVARAFSELFKD